MPDCTSANFFGRIKDERAYAPSETVDGANSEAGSRPYSCRHDKSSSLRKSAEPGTGAIHADQFRQ
jgi:hypothetical protein